MSLFAVFALLLGGAIAYALYAIAVAVESVANTKERELKAALERQADAERKARIEQHYEGKKKPVDPAVAQLRRQAKRERLVEKHKEEARRARAARLGKQSH